MSSSVVVQYALYFIVLFALTPLLGTYIKQVFSDQKNWLSPIVGPFERFTYRVCFIKPNEEMTWQNYASSVVLVSIIGLATTFYVQISQSSLGLNPQNLPDVPWLLAFNTAISFVTNTNW